MSEARDGVRRVSARRLITVAVGALLISISTVPTLRREGVAFAVGAVCGAALLALVIRSAWVRFGPGKPPVWDPPRLVLMTGAIAALSAVATANDHNGTQVETFLSDAAATCPDPIAMIRQGGVPIVEAESTMDVAAITSNEAALIEHTRFAEIDDASGYRYVVFIALGRDEEDLVAFLDGVAAAVEREGSTVYPLQFAETPGYGYTDDGIAMTATVLSCHAVLIWADRAASTEKLAAELVAIDHL